MMADVIPYLGHKTIFGEIFRGSFGSRAEWNSCHEYDDGKKPEWSPRMVVMALVPRTLPLGVIHLFCDILSVLFQWGF